MHAFDSPLECSQLFLPTFLTDYFQVCFGLEGYKRWLDARPLEAWIEAYQFYKMQLQRLAWQEQSEQRWILKSPHHLTHLDALLAVFPDACIIQTHRDPVDVIHSSARYYGSIYQLHCKPVPHAHHEQRCLELFSSQVTRGMDLRTTLPEQNILDISYQELIHKPAEILDLVSDRYDLPNDASIKSHRKAWLDTHHWKRDNKLGALPRSKPSIETDKINDHFAAYSQCYNWR